MREKRREPRRIIMTGLIMACFVAFAGMLIKLQVVDGEAYLMKGSSISEKTVVIRAARGEILDRNGNPLVTNRQGYSLVFESALFPSPKQMKERGEIIHSLIQLLDEHEVLWKDNLPLVFDENGAIAFAANRERDIAYMKSRDMLNLQHYATASDCFNALIERYELEGYAPADARDIASVCYEMRRLIFNVSNPYTFAEDVPVDIVAIIKENSAFYRGVEVEIVPYREYADGTLAPHILGMVGAINAEEYEQLKESGYRLNDIIGKNGIEAAMEEYLRGVDGIKTVYTDAEGKVTTKITTPPIQGNTVILSIDINLQRTAQEALESMLKSYKTPVEPAGAVVALNCNTGEVLASASYPTYDISAYNENYEQLAKAPGAPLWNRAFLSAYECGSTMKPSVAIAGLEEGLITRNYTFYCSGTYHFSDMNFRCSQPHATRHVNVLAALKESCNTYFYDLGRRLGIERINEYRTLLGLGQKTGIEISEAAGVMDTPQYRESLGQTWLPGYTIQTAIGQASNLFTPLQLANYTATIANGGTRYRPHLVRSIKTYDFSETVLDKEVLIDCETGLSKDNLAIVREGMRLVATEGSCRHTFEKLPFDVAAKTGTSQVIKNINGVSTITNNGLLISFAPAEKPEIAVAFIAEGFRSGTRASPITGQIYEHYFSATEKAAPPQPINQVLA